MAVNEAKARQCARRKMHMWEKLIWKNTGGYTWAECLSCGIRAYYGTGSDGKNVGFAFEDGRSVLWS